MKDFIIQMVGPLLDFAAEVLLPFLGFILFFVVVIGGLFVGLRYVGHSVDTNECRTYAITTGRDTQFVDYTWWTWDCLTPARDGKWIPTDQLVEVVR